MARTVTRLSAAAAVVVASLAFAACGGDPGATQTTPSTPATSPTPTPTPTPTFEPYQSDRWDIEYADQCHPDLGCEFYPEEYYLQKYGKSLAELEAEDDIEAPTEYDEYEPSYEDGGERCSGSICW